MGKKLKVGINGFGRIGRAVYRINLKRQEFDVVAVNEANPDIKNITYLLQYDTTYGKLDSSVEHSDDSIFVGPHTTRVYHKQNIADVPWDEHDIDVVVDSSGIKTNLAALQQSRNKVRNYIVTNSPGDHNAVKTIIFGVNEEECDPSQHKVFSSSICDTNAFAPLIKLISETHNIESGYLVTLHAWLSYQNLLDGPSVSWSQPGDIFSHYALGRACPQNIIPKSTSAVVAAEHIFPGISKKIQSFSYRVPTQIVSGAVMILLLDHDIAQSELIKRCYDYESAQKYKVVRNSVEPLTSVDYRGEEYSVIIDHRWTKVENGRHLKLVYWYDNEWGYSSRVVDLIKRMANG
jgi:glyceraldehyde 3-phosphate dehydrogenase